MPRGSARVRPPSLGPAFRTVFTANMSASLGDGIMATVGMLLTARITHDPVQVALVGTFSMLPWLFFALPAGVLVDAVDRRVLMAIAGGVRTLLGVTLLAVVWTDSLTIGWIYLVVFAYGMCETVYDGSARGIVPTVVQPAQLPRANSRIEATEVVLQQFLAAPLTSALFVVSALIPLGATVALFGIAAVLALYLPRAARGPMTTPEREVAAWGAHFTEGFHFLWRHPILRTQWMLSIVYGFTFSAANATMVLFVLDTLEVPEALFGVYGLGGAVGGLAGSLVASRLTRRFGLGRSMALANVALGAAMMGIGLMPTVATTLPLFVVGAMCLSVWNIGAITLHGFLVPEELFGRVHGTRRTLLWGTMPLGALAGGFVAHAGLPVPFIVFGAAELAVTLVFFGFLSRLPNPPERVAEVGA